MNVVKWLVVILLIAGALNWGLVGAFHMNVVTMLLGETMWANVIYILIGLAGIAKIFLIAMKK